MFRINYTDPWLEGDDKRTSRAINIQVRYPKLCVL
jgi:outer membrane protein insertion porin family